MSAIFTDKLRECQHRMLISERGMNVRAALLENGRVVNWICIRGMCQEWQSCEGKEWAKTLQRTTENTERAVWNRSKGLFRKTNGDVNTGVHIRWRWQSQWRNQGKKWPGIHQISEWQPHLFHPNIETIPVTYKQEEDQTLSWCRVFQSLEAWLQMTVGTQHNDLNKIINISHGYL